MQQILQTDQYEVFEFVPTGFSSNIFVLKTDQQSILIDVGLPYNKEEPRATLTKIIDTPEKYGTLTKVILTHCHVDHIGCLVIYESLFKKNNIPVYASPQTANLLNDFKANLRIIDPITSYFKNRNIESEIQPLADTLQVGNLTLNVLKTPGHTLGSICLYSEQEAILFTGDTVFPHGSFGRTDLPSGNGKTLVQSLKTLSQLQCNHFFPGHMQSVLENGHQHIMESYRNCKSYIP